MAAWNVARLRRLAVRAKRAVEFELLARARRAPIDENTVFYESFAGNGMLCNPEAIFRALLDAEDFSHLNHVWALDRPADHAATVSEFAGHPRVRFVEYQSNAYFAALARAKYLVNNATFPPQFGKRPGQVYLNTWHGTPLKTMGYDVPGGVLETRNVVRNLLAADYLLAPNEDTAEMYLSAYRMRNVFHGAIVDEGSPRVDRQFAEQPPIRSRLHQRGVTVGDGRQVILYAPTWKGSFYAPVNDIRQLRARIEAIAAQIDTTKYQLLLKVHQQVYKHAVVDDALRNLLVPNDVATNDMLAVTDVLITDYSSIFIDFLATGRPILFFTPDMNDYESTRGLYVPASGWPGPVCSELDDLVAHIKRLNTGTADDPVRVYADAYATSRSRYCPREDGHATQRLIDAVFRGDEAHVRRGFSDGRTPILVHMGGMLPNGITASGLCLLDNIDHERFDVTASFPITTAPEKLHLISLINPKVRVLPRFGGINGGKWQVRSMLAMKGRTPAQHERSYSGYVDLWRDEWMRCFGAARFERILDFSGYSPFWLKLLRSGESRSLSVWMHNDIKAEANNPGRNAWLRASLDGMCAQYQHADHLVSVSEALRDVNAEHLRGLAPAERFTYARNTINYERVRHLAYGVRSRLADVDGSFDPSDLAESIRTLMAQAGSGEVVDEVERRVTIAQILPDAPGVRTFVTAGRLSPEKNHERLVRAFDKVHQNDPETRLVVLGSGPLEERMAELVAELGLSSVVTLAGHQPNPYVVLAHSDCFVLSSDYEGQPMVLLEALILGLPIVTTDFGSVRGAVPDGYGLIVPRTVDDLAAGMTAFLDGEVPTREFDCAAYNRDAMAEVYRAIGAA